MSFLRSLKTAITNVTRVRRKKDSADRISRQPVDERHFPDSDSKERILPPAWPTRQPDSRHEVPELSFLVLFLLAMPLSCVIASQCFGELNTEPNLNVGDKIPIQGVNAIPSASELIDISPTGDAETIARMVSDPLTDIGPLCRVDLSDLEAVNGSLTIQAVGPTSVAVLLNGAKNFDFPQACPANALLQMPISVVEKLAIQAEIPPPTPR